MKVAVLSVLLLASFTVAAEAQQACPKAATIFPNGSVELDGKLFASRAELKTYLVQYRKHHPPCTMLILVHNGTALNLADDVTAVLAVTGQTPSHGP